MAAHRYWRLLNRINNGGSFSGLTEIEMRTTSGGSDVTTGGTAISTGTIQAGTAAQCFDGDTTTTLIQFTGTGSGSGFSVGYDFGSGNDKDIVEIKVWPDKDGANRAFAEFDVQFSDDNATWTTSWSITYTAWVVGTPVVFTKPTIAAHRYWRIRPFGAFNGATSGFGIAEVEMKDTVGGTDQCTGGTASARTAFAGSGAANAFDNSSATLYSHNSAVGESDWLQYDFGSGVTKTILEVTLLARADTSWAQCPTSAYVESSSDNASFIERFRFTTAVGGPGYTMREIAPASLPSAPAGKHRFWGIKANTVQSGSVFGTAEVELRAIVGGSTIISGGAGASQHPFASDRTAPPSNAFDATTGTEYASTILPDILVYDFSVGSEKVCPAQIKLRARSSTNNTQAPTGFNLVYSDDGQTFTVQETFSTAGTWSAGEERLFTVTSSVANRRRQMIMC